MAMSIKEESSEPTTMKVSYLLGVIYFGVSSTIKASISWFLSIFVSKPESPASLAPQTASDSVVIQTYDIANPSMISQPMFIPSPVDLSHHTQVNTKALGLTAESEKPFDVSITIASLPNESTEETSIHLHDACFGSAIGKRKRPKDMSMTKKAGGNSTSPSEDLPLYHTTTANRSSSTQTASSINSQSQMLNPVVKLVRDHDLGKTVLGFIVPMTIGFITIYNKDASLLPLHLILAFLSIGLVAIWNGILLRDLFPKVATAVELLGAACVFCAFFTVVGSFLPPVIVWISWVSLSLCFAPVFFSYLPLVESNGLVSIGLRSGP